MSGPTVKCRLDLKRPRARPVMQQAENKASADAATPVAPRPPTATAGSATSVARVLALAHWIEREVRTQRFASYRDAARHLGVSHARVQHVVGLLFLPAPVQADLLAGDPYSERQLRSLATCALWPAS